MTIDNNVNLLKSVDDFNYIQLNNINKNNNNCILDPTNSLCDATTTNSINGSIGDLNKDVQTQYDKISNTSVKERVANYKNDQSQRIQWVYSYFFYFYYLLYFIFVGYVIFNSFIKEKTGFQGIKKHGIPILGYLMFPFLIGFLQQFIFWIFSFLQSVIVSNVFYKNIY